MAAAAQRAREWTLLLWACATAAQQQAAPRFAVGSLPLPRSVQLAAQPANVQGLTAADFLNQLSRWIVENQAAPPRAAAAPPRKPQRTAALHLFREQGHDWQLDPRGDDSPARLPAGRRLGMMT